MTPRTKENSNRINVFFPPEVVERLKQEAKAKGITVSAYVRMIVFEFLANKK